MQEGSQILPPKVGRLAKEKGNLGNKEASNNFGTGIGYGREMDTVLFVI